MRSIFLLLCSLLVLGTTVPAQTIAIQKMDPATAGFRKEGFTRLSKLVQQYVDSQWIAGATMIVMKDGGIVYHEAIGYSDITSREKLRTDHIFRIASQTKAITSTGIMMLLEQGRLLLDDPVSNYLPAFANTVVLDKFNDADSSYTTQKAKRPITIRDLLTHTSGIGYAQIGSDAYRAIAAKAGVNAFIGVPSLSLEEQVNRVAALPLEHQPGERFTYGLNTDVLGRIIEVVNKQPLDQFFRKQIFDPLGMKDTWFYLPADKHARLVTLHGEDSTGKLIRIQKDLELGSETMDPDYPRAKGKLFSGGGGLASTAYDYALFMQMILNGGELNGKRILSSNSVRLMSMNQLGDLANGNNKFGLGFGIYTVKEASRLGVPAGTLEWGGAFNSSYWIDNENGIVAQLFINQWPNSHGDIHDKFKVQVYSALED